MFSDIDIFPKYAAIIGDRQSVFGLQLAPGAAEQWLISTQFGSARQATPPYVNRVADAEVSFPGHESWREFYTRNASLSIFRVGLASLVLREDRNASARLGKCDRSPQTRHTAADHEKVRFQRHYVRM